MARPKSGRNGVPVKIYLCRKLRRMVSRKNPKLSLSKIITDALNEKFAA